MPSNRPSLSLLLAVYEWLHPMIVQAVRLDQVNDIELVGLVFARVARAEVEPLAKLLGTTMVKLEF